ncbi:MAG: di-heme enzyme [Deltaproteobacteria bacterium]|nr:di-heme enzyme [Deltaproteobacteria bacterium]
MNLWIKRGFLAIAMAAAAGCETEEPAAQPAAYVWKLPVGMPTPKVPADNPMSDAKVALGRRLFYDKRLSGNEKQACASCHQQARGFADELPVGVGSTGQKHVRGSMGLANVGFAAALTWGNPTVTSLEKQALVPLFGEAPVELGLAGQEQALLKKLSGDADYPKMFAAAFGSSAPTVQRVVQAIASFERTLVAGNSPWHRYLRGEAGAVADDVKRGSKLFFSERLECFHCHSSSLFSDSVDWVGKLAPEMAFHNTGLYNLGGSGAYPTGNQGVYDVTGKPSDIGRFKAPSLINIAVTAPYFHDGSAPTLDAVLDHYAAGGRKQADGPLAGDGTAHPNKSQFVRGFTLTAAERADLLAFLSSLTDQEFLTDPRFGDPFVGL